MTPATERIVVQVTPSQKEAIRATAKRLGLNVGELLRQAAQGFQPRLNDAQLEKLLDRVNASTQDANDAIDDTLASIRQSNQRIAALNKRSVHGCD